MANIADRILELRTTYGLSRLDLAKRLGVNKSTITRYELGEMNPTIDMLIKMHDVFGVTIDWLAGVDTNGVEKYVPAVQECIKNGIAPEALLMSAKALSAVRKE